MLQSNPLTPAIQPQIYQLGDLNLPLRKRMLRVQVSLRFWLWKDDGQCLFCLPIINKTFNPFHSFQIIHTLVALLRLHKFKSPMLFQVFIFHDTLSQSKVFIIISHNRLKRFFPPKSWNHRTRICGHKQQAQLINGYFLIWNRTWFKLILYSFIMNVLRKDKQETAQ